MPKLEEHTNRKDLMYESNKHAYGFKYFWEIWSFGDSIFSGKIIISETDENKTNYWTLF